MPSIGIRWSKLHATIYQRIIRTDAKRSSEPGTNISRSVLCQLVGVDKKPEASKITHNWLACQSPGHHRLGCYAQATTKSAWHTHPAAEPTVQLLRKQKLSAFSWVLRWLHLLGGAFISFSWYARCDHYYLEKANLASVIHASITSRTGLL